LKEALTVVLKVKLSQVPNISITDVLGNLISKEFYTISSIDSENIKIHFNNLSSGVYFVNFEVNGESFSQKIIRQ
jgi:hypothetical protein